MKRSWLLIFTIAMLLLILSGCGEDVMEGDYSIESFGENGLRMTISSKYTEHLKQRAIQEALRTIESRVDEFNVREPQIYTQRDFGSGVTQIVVRLPGEVDPEKAKKLIGKTAMLDFRLVEKPEYTAGSKEKLLEQIGGVLPEGYSIFEGVTDTKYGKFWYLLRQKPVVFGKDLKDARQGYDEKGMFAVDFKFNDDGAKLFGHVTGKNIGKQLAIVFDDLVISAPSIRTRIGRRGQITGNFSAADANELAIFLRSGSLPVPVSIDEERTVGPSLGAESISKGRFSLLVGGILVLAFMLFYYRISGLIADFALVLNILFMLGALAMFGATLTLPGIAGIVLTIGMAVDANVIIFERIREELRLGKTPRVAVDSGYGKALWTILDANITTAVAAIVLFQFGTGPIKGFAVTLSIGIITSVFTALVVTRTIFDIIVSRRGKMKTLSI